MESYLPPFFYFILVLNLYLKKKKKKKKQEEKLNFILHVAFFYFCLFLTLLPFVCQFLFAVIVKLYRSVADTAILLMYIYSSNKQMLHYTHVHTTRYVSIYLLTWLGSSCYTENQYL